VQSVTFQLRDFEPGDADAVNDVALAAFAEFRHAYDDWPAISLGVGDTASLATVGEMIVAVSEGEVVGAVTYVGPGRPKREYFPEHWPVVRMLVVSPAARGRGIGRALMEECVRRAERDGAELIALHTSAIMRVALPLYLRMGFAFDRAVEPICGVPYAVYVKPLTHPARREGG